MFCKHCGAQLPDGSQFCSNCGKPLGDVDGVTPETEVPVAVPVSNIVTSGIEPESGANQAGDSANQAGPNAGGAGPNLSETGQAGPEPTSPKPKKKLSKGAKIGIAVGAAVLVVVIVLVLVFTLGGHHKNDVGDGRYADGRTCYRYLNPEEKDTMDVTDLTITPTSEGMVAEFYIDNYSSNSIAWGMGMPGRIVLKMNDGTSYISSADDINHLIPVGSKNGLYQIFFRNAKGVPQKLSLLDLIVLDGNASPLDSGFTYSTELDLVTPNK